jgi:multidrug efflux pump subunit AcrA (membrane-fusion protein)
MTRKAIRITVAGIVVTILAAAALYRVLGYAAAVEAVPVTEGAVPVTIKGPGTVEARFPVTLSARITATITNLHVDQGDAVKRGQLVATLDDRDLAAKRAGSVQTQETARRNVTAAQAAVAKAEAELDLARTKHRRDQDLLRAGYVSQSVMDSSAATLRSAEANLENALLLPRARRTRDGRAEAAYASAVLSTPASRPDRRDHHRAPGRDRQHGRGRADLPHVDRRRCGGAARSTSRSWGA